LEREKKEYGNGEHRLKIFCRASYQFAYLRYHQNIHQRIEKREYEVIAEVDHCLNYQMH
jgi:hypothetical protein